ncbi:uncharacterized protein MELLADRAFT_101090 [Melampsora larici-populina 98AG31]|uniref:YTH domain-containing protein n=1 Tax=Melampsora larici-populina (strain 98AG31 / pathotype 3-4-7) TaxID=747676 RepID=F4R3K9_MELLP|nr:uncharacterized protein MELLADRAFT_101090 [Melampsora larici-populina 98AG31]EGG13149.1 hypothetical protein MELLADRAFT_101090 [Melampsora larici-populina 98AG31]
MTQETSSSPPPPSTTTTTTTTTIRNNQSYHHQSTYQPYQPYHHHHHSISNSSNPSTLPFHHLNTSPLPSTTPHYSIPPPLPIQPSQSQSNLIHSTYSPPPPPSLSFSPYSSSNFQSPTLDHHSSYYNPLHQAHSNPSSPYQSTYHHQPPQPPQPIPISYLNFSHHQSNSPPPSFDSFSPTPSHFPINERSYQIPPSSPSAFNTPFNSPRSRPPFGSRSHHHHHHLNHHLNHSSPFLPFLHQTSYSPTSTHSTHEPKSPTSPPINSLVRGSLAQAKLRNHRLKLNPIGSQPFNTQAIHHSHKPRHSKSSQKPALPRPPSHSEHALWVGNVPNDASHEELWKFFSGPHSTPSTSGVESIHLISRSNCAFVNYLSQVHLQHAITVCNGKTLRPFDPRSKPLVCRVRNPEDNVKSGVGAQRIGGMHRSWIRKTIKSNEIIDRDVKLQQSRSIGNEDQCKRTSSTSTFNSNQTNSSGTASTSSSFLSRHFPRRYFILKSYTEEDLNLSVERSVWASQSHNEPILDQAYRTSSEGVYLIFSANRSGEFYGYAKMTGPIWRSIHPPISVPNSPISRPSLITNRRASANDLVLPLPPLLVEKDEGLEEEKTGLEGRLLPAFQERRTTASPVPISPCVPFIGLAPPISLTGGPSRSLPELIRLETSVEKKEAKESGGVVVVVKETEGLDDEGEEEEVMGSEDSVGGDGRPFEIEWIKVQKLPFHLTRDLKNPFNGHREVKVSRDGTEIEPSIGAILVSRIDEASTS